MKRPRQPPGRAGVRDIDPDNKICYFSIPRAAEEKEEEEVLFSSRGSLAQHGARPRAHSHTQPSRVPRLRRHRVLLLLSN